MYKKLSDNWNNRNFKYLWKAKIPPKIKILLWLIGHNAIASKIICLKEAREVTQSVDSMKRRKILGICFFFALQQSLYGITEYGKCNNRCLNRHDNFTQYFHWVAKYARGLTNIHMVGIAALCWAMWKLRNRACFERKKLIRSPPEIIFYACSFLKYWTCLQKKVIKR
jgi:hypothetical protein